MTKEKLEIPALGSLKDIATEYNILYRGFESLGYNKPSPPDEMVASNNSLKEVNRLMYDLKDMATRARTHLKAVDEYDNNDGKIIPFALEYKVYIGMNLENLDQNPDENNKEYSERVNLKKISNLERRLWFFHPFFEKEDRVPLLNLKEFENKKYKNLVSTCIGGGLSLATASLLYSVGMFEEDSLILNTVIGGMAAFLAGIVGFEGYANLTKVDLNKTLYEPLEKRCKKADEVRKVIMKYAREEK